jgi:hypothetical protein
MPNFEPNGKEVPTMTTLQRIEQSQGKLLAAIDSRSSSGQLAALDSILTRLGAGVARVEQKIGDFEGRECSRWLAVQGRLDAMEGVLVEQVRQQGKNFDVMCLILRILDAYSFHEFKP